MDSGQPKLSKRMLLSENNLDGDFERSSYLQTPELESKTILQNFNLSWDDRKNGHINTIELIEASPRSTLRQAREDLANRLQEHKRDILQKQLLQNEYKNVC